MLDSLRSLLLKCKVILVMIKAFWINGSKLSLSLDYIMPNLDFEVESPP